MIDLNTNTLLAGGALAAVAGFWSQVRGFLSQIGGYFILHADVDTYAMRYVVKQHLKRHYKVLPSGLVAFKAIYAMKPGTSFSRTVPFQLQDSKWGVFYRGREVFLFNGRTLLGIRGLHDFKELLSAALTEEEERYTKTVVQKTGSSLSRFQVFHIIGRDSKDLLGDVQRHNQTSSDTKETAPQGASSIDGSSDGPFYLDLNLDRSFLYERHEYQENPDKVDPIRHLYFDSDVLRHIEQAKRWSSSFEWYSERQIPWRRGWVLEGPPGTGKSSLASGIAESMGFPLYSFHLSTLSDSEFIRHWDQMSLPAVVLLEDFDAIFEGRKNILANASLSFDTILNAVSGVGSKNGVFLIITTNHLEKLDEAVGVKTTIGGEVSTRPGRIDTVIRLGHISQTNRLRMANRILRDWPDLIEEVVKLQGEFTPCQFQEVCVQRALARISQEEEGTLWQGWTAEQWVSAASDVNNLVFVEDK